MVLSLLFVISILILTGLIGIFIGRSNLVFIIISLEILVLSLVLWFVLIGWLNFGDLKSIIIGILMLVIGASESAIGLALAIAYYKFTQKI